MKWQGWCEKPEITKAPSPGVSAVVSKELPPWKNSSFKHDCIKSHVCLLRKMLDFIGNTPWLAKMKYLFVFFSTKFLKFCRLYWTPVDPYEFPWLPPKKDNHDDISPTAVLCAMAGSKTGREWAEGSHCCQVVSFHTRVPQNWHLKTCEKPMGKYKGKIDPDLGCRGWFL